LFVAHKRRPELPSPRPSALVAAALYASFSVWLLYNAFEAQTSLLPWLAVPTVVGLGAYFATVRRQRATTAPPSE
jgi:hypothetical protein